MPATALTAAIGALPGLLGHWDLGTIGLPKFSGTLPVLTADPTPGTVGQPSIVPGDPTNLSVAGKTSATSGIGTIPDSAWLAFTTGMTLGIFVKPSSIFSSRDAGLIHQTSGYHFALNGSKVQLFTNGATTSPSHIVVPGETIFCVATDDGANERVYANGVEVATRAKTGSMTNSGSSLRIGAQEFGGPVNGFVGAAQHPFICNQAATVAQIRTVYELAAKPAAEVAGQAIFAMPWSRVAIASAVGETLSNASDADVWVAKGSTAVKGGGILLRAMGGRWEVPASYGGPVSVISDGFMGGKLVGIG